MAGIYIHIPYCKKACHYCNFHFSTSLTSKNEFLKSLLHEIKLQKNYLQQEPIETIYFGGGTPSLMQEDELLQILDAIRHHFIVEDLVECTLEANPDDISFEKISSWKKIGINRLSIGIQSFYEEDLHYMNRSHSSQQAKECVRMAQAGGIDNISIDLIFGYPLLNHAKWASNIEQAFSLNVTHISCYAMTVEPKTALASFISTKKELPIDAEQGAEQFLFLMDQMKKQGFEHYEISNYAKPNFRAKHNTNYWKGVPYLGLGPSAHSFNGISRQWNISNNALYIKSISENIVPFELETLTAEEKFNEYIMVSLRMIDGVDLQKAKSLFPQVDFQSWLKGAETIQAKNLVSMSTTTITLTNEGRLFADDIASNLFV